MPIYKFKQVDVFTDRPLYGNPVAVVLDADGIDPKAMQRIAAWTNLSETTFVLKPTTPAADYRLRIFTPAAELPFAGHPTVGSAHAALEAGVISGATFSQECGAGVLPMSVTETEAGPRIAVEAPEATFVKEFGDRIDELSEALGAPLIPDPAPAAMDNGPSWIFCRLASSAAVAGLRPDMSAMAMLERELRVTGTAVFALLEGDGPSVHIRCFAPSYGVNEDPVTGSANAALPAYLSHVGMLDALGGEYVSTQGTELGRDGKVYVRVLDNQGRAEIGGHAVTVIEGEIRL